MDNQTSINRWRLILGKYSQNNLEFKQDGEENGNLENLNQLEETLDYLYLKRQRDTYKSQGGNEATRLDAVTWISNVRKLFPKSAIEKIERHAIEEFNMKELLCDKETLEKMEPNFTLLKNIIAFKNHMNREVIELANNIVAQVVKEISEKMQQDIKKSILGKVNKNKSSNVKIYKNFDVKKTIEKNLKNYEPTRKKLILDNIYFNSNIRRHNEYRVIIVVDESGSMIDSIIHSSIMAGIFAKLPMLDIKLVIFDTNVVDLSNYVDNPVEVLMKVQLGGGTNIGKALEYSASLVENPSKTIMVLISDLFEGDNPKQMYSVIKQQIDSGTKFITLTSLDNECEPVFDRNVAKKITSLGGFVGSMTPDKLGDFIGNIIR